MTTKAYKELYAMAKDEDLMKILKWVPCSHPSEYHLGKDIYPITKTEYITQLLLYLMRETTLPPYFGQYARKYNRFDYTQLRKDVFELVKKLSGQECGWINKQLAELEPNETDPAILKARKDFRSYYETSYAFR